MRKIKLLLWVSLLTMSCFEISAQNDLCTTDADDPDILQGIPPYHRVIAAASYDTCTFSLFFHIIRRSNGTGGQNMQGVNAAVNRLSADYLPYRIGFKLAGVDEINNDSYYNDIKKGRTDLYNNINGDGKFANFKPNANDDAIDIYLFAADGNFNEGRTPGIPSTALAIGGYDTISNVDISSSHVLSHEFGHCLGLYHTFRGLCEDGCAEFVDGSNCSTCGDYVCDTPADPKTFRVTEYTCIWNGEPCPGGSVTDAHGDYYQPDNSLLMAYIPPTCSPQYITPGQVERIKATIAASSVLRDALFHDDGPVGFYDEVNIQNPGSGTVSNGLPVPNNTYLIHPCSTANFYAEFDAYNSTPFNYEWSLVLYREDRTEYVYAQNTAGGTPGNAHNQNTQTSGSFWQTATGALPNYDWWYDVSGNIAGKITVTLNASGSSLTDETDIGLVPVKVIENVIYSTDTTIDACSDILLKNVQIQGNPTVIFNMNGFELTIDETFEAPNSAEFILNP